MFSALGLGASERWGWKDYLLSHLSKHRAQTSPSASASVSLPGLCCSLTLFLPPPPTPTSRLSSGKLQEFGVGDGSKLTLVPTVEAGLMVNG